MKWITIIILAFWIQPGQSFGLEFLGFNSERNPRAVSVVKKKIVKVKPGSLKANDAFDMAKFLSPENYKNRMAMLNAPVRLDVNDISKKHRAWPACRFDDYVTLASSFSLFCVPFESNRQPGTWHPDRFCRTYETSCRSHTFMCCIYHLCPDQQNITTTQPPTTVTTTPVPITTPNPTTPSGLPPCPLDGTSLVCSQPFNSTCLQFSNVLCIMPGTQIECCYTGPVMTTTTIPDNSTTPMTVDFSTTLTDTTPTTTETITQRYGSKFRKMMFRNIVSKIVTSRSSETTTPITSDSTTSPIDTTTEVVTSSTTTAEIISDTTTAISPDTTSATDTTTTIIIITDSTTDTTPEITTDSTTVPIDTTTVVITDPSTTSVDSTTEIITDSTTSATDSTPTEPPTTTAATTSEIITDSTTSADTTTSAISDTSTSPVDTTTETITDSTTSADTTTTSPDTTTTLADTTTEIIISTIPTDITTILDTTTVIDTTTTPVATTCPVATTTAPETTTLAPTFPPGVYCTDWTQSAVLLFVNASIQRPENVCCFPLCALNTALPNCPYLCWKLSTVPTSFLKVLPLLTGLKV